MNNIIDQKEMNKLLKNLENFEPKLVKSILTLAVKAGAKDVQQAAISYAPYDTGVLRDSIKIVKKRVAFKYMDGDSKNSTVYTVGITKDAWYGAAIEFGTEMFPPDPFMVPAFELNGTGALNAMKDYIKLRFDRQMKKELL